MKKKYLNFLCVTLLFINVITSQNLLNNGDFESGGNGVGFSINSSFYNNISAPFSGITSPGNYAITTNPQPMNTNFFISGGDHTTGIGNMLVVDATSTGGAQRFWRAGNNGGGICGLTVGTTYTFSYWIKSVSVQVTNTSTRADIGYQFNNATNITLVAGFLLAPLPSSGWQQVIYTFTPTNSCVNFELWDNNINAIGNDFAVDDFELLGPPQPLTLTYSAVNPSCPGANDGYIIAYAAGANLPYVYFLDAPIQLNNSTGVFAGLSAGTYSIRVLEAADGEITINNIVLSDAPSLTVSSPTTICLGSNVELNVSGSATGCNWTASPVDDSLVDPSISNPTVSPTQTTTYTVTSTSSSSPNLIFNGNFDAGNVGFQTDYVYFSTNNPNGIQRAYGIVTNANAWESGFSNCFDHTTGNGKMMVVDGSIVNGGNDKVWCQTIAVAPNQNYTFSYWIQTVATLSPANIDIVINGTTIGSALAPSTTCGWVQRSYTWNSGANTTAQICIYDRETAANGNDFAIDDLSFIGPTINCNLSKSVTITVNNPTTPSFEPITPICSGQVLGPLPTTSAENITGSWTPAITNQVTTTYTFTPDANQCATTTTLEIVVSDNLTAPEFFFGPSETYCFGAPIDAPLPLLSINGISGIWNSVGINTQLVGETTYTFTPNEGQCATTFTLIVNVQPTIIPLFDLVGAVCIGDPLQPLPTTSLNNITGTWTPELNNMATTTYTFTPDLNQCAGLTTLAIIIIPANLVPTFNFGNAITRCFQPIGEVPPISLPTTSENGIPGFWTPESINYAALGESIYTFTPIVNTCAARFVLTVNIVENPEFKINAGCDGDNFVLSLNQNEVYDATYTWYNNSNQVISNAAAIIITEKGDYKVIVTFENGCSNEQLINIPSIYCKIPKGISPNDDALNDFFDLSNLNVRELKIFNRYGTQVYAKANYKKEWNGKTDNGNELPDGTYYYVLNFDTGKSKTGWVYINKTH